MRPFLRKGEATRMARTLFRWSIEDPGGHLAPPGELRLIVMDCNISITGRENLHPLCPPNSSDKGQIRIKKKKKNSSFQ